MDESAVKQTSKHYDLSYSIHQNTTITPRVQLLLENVALYYISAYPKWKAPRYTELAN